MNRRHRVLLIAEAANPEWVSVPLIGWSLANAMTAVSYVHIVTQVRNQAAFERAGLVAGKDFTAIDTEAMMRPLWAVAEKLRGGEGKGWTMLTAIHSLSYPLFERMVWKQFGQAIKDGQFDVVHRVTPLSPTASSSLAKRCNTAGVPFVVGPLNGGVQWPKEFTKERHQEKEWLSYIRSIYKIMPGIRKTWKNCSAIICGSHHTETEISKSEQRKIIYIPENAISSDRFKNYGDNEGRYELLNLCFIGRLVPYKGPDIAILAAQNLLRSGTATLTIIGDGPMMGELRALTQHLGVESAVKFAGWVDHAQIPEVAREQSVFLFPSVREFGGGAVIEAMALGLVPIVANYGGPAEIVVEGTGFKLPIGSREILIDGAKAILGEIVAGRHDLAKLSAQGQQRISDFYTWEQKAAQLIQVYDWVTGVRTEKPCFKY